jgi:transposase-like protein
MAQEWQNKPLERQYLIVWMDGIVFKVKDDGKVLNKTVYLYVGLDKTGHKQVLGLWLGMSESSSFWMSVLTDKNRVSYPNDDAVKKSVYLAISEVERKWIHPYRNWGIIFNQFIAIFENRILS